MSDAAPPPPPAVASDDADHGAFSHTVFVSQPPAGSHTPPPPPPDDEEEDFLPLEQPPPTPTPPARATPSPVSSSSAAVSVSAPSGTSASLPPPSPTVSPAPPPPPAARATLGVAPTAVSSGRASPGGGHSPTPPAAAAGSTVPAAPGLPSGTFSPAARKPVPISGSSNTYQSLSASFGDAPANSSSSSSSGLGGSSLGGSTAHPGLKRAEIAGPASVAHVSSGGASVVFQQTRNRSGSIDRLTGRLPYPASQAPGIKVGWLKKEGEGVLGGHKKRWCVLAPRTLDFFKEVTDDKTQGTTILPGATILPEDKLDFHILPVNSKSFARKVSFRCETEHERNTWVKMLQEQSYVPDSLLEACFDSDSYADWSSQDIHNILLPSLTRLLSKVGTMSSIWGVNEASGIGVLLSGYLTKMGEKVRNFKRRYFVLIGSCLLYFENEESYMMTDTGAAVLNPGQTKEQAAVAAAMAAFTGGASSGSAAAAAAAAAASSSSGGGSSGSLAGGVVQPNAPVAPKTSHGKEVFASLARTHLRAQRRSITPVDLQNHHLIRRTSSMPLNGGPAGAASASGSIGSGKGGFNEGGHQPTPSALAIKQAMEEEADKKKLMKRAIKGDGKSALGMIPLRECTLALEHGSRPFGFSLQTRDRKYFLFAENEEELRAWVYMLNLIVISLPIKGYMKHTLETELAEEGKLANGSNGAAAPAAAAASASSPPPLSRGLSSTAWGGRPRVVPMLSESELLLLKKQLVVTLLDPTCCRYLQCYWLERQSFHEARTYPQLFPLDSPLSLVDPLTREEFFGGLLVDEAGERGENSLTVPLHYLYFWLEVERWMDLKAPSRPEGGGEDSNEYATAQDPSFVASCIPLPLSYRQARAEEIIERYLTHGAPYPVYLEQQMIDDILSHSLRGTAAPNKIAPLDSLFQKAQELVTELLAIEVFPRYLRSRSSCWGYLAAIQGKYDETLIFNRAERLAPELLARNYEIEVYEELTPEEKEQEEDDRLKKFSNLVSQRAEDVQSLMLECAEQFHKLPNTDPTKLLYHNYLYALQRLRDYHALFNEDLQASLQVNKPPVSLEFRQGAAAKAFFHDFLQSGSPWALCVPYKLVRNLRSQLMHVGRSHRSEYLFMDIEHVVITELRIGLEEAKTKVRKQVLNQLSPLKKSSINPLTGLAAKQEALGGGNSPSHGNSNSAASATPAPVPRRSVAMRGSISGGSGGLPGMGNGKLALEVVQEYAAAAPPPPATTTLASFNFSESDVPFSMVFGVSSLFASFKRYSLICRHANPQYLWNQLALVSRIFDLRAISEPKVLALAAKQAYAQFLSDTAPAKVNISKSVLDQCKVGVSTASPGPHVFMGVLRELYNNLNHLYTNSFKTSEAAASLFACMQEDFGLFVRSEICVTQGKREQAFDASISLMSNNKNAATWLDLSDLKDLKELDESLVNLSSHQAMWCAYFKQFLTERFCSENAIFFAEADDYRRAPGPSYRVLKAKRLYERYISDNAQLQVNVPSWVARELTTILARDGAGAAGIAVKSGGGPPTLQRPSSAASGSIAGASAPLVDLTASSPLLYIAAQREIFLLILNDSLKPWMESQPWRNYKQSCQAKITL